MSKPVYKINRWQERNPTVESPYRFFAILQPQFLIMIEKKQPVSVNNDNLFGKENYIWIIAGIVSIALGLFLMAGGKSDDPNVFDPKEVYSKTRITVAPILILLGLALEIFAIFRKPKN